MKLYDQLTNVMIRGGFKTEYYTGWSEIDLQSIINKDIESIGLILIDKLTESGATILSAYIVLHDPRTMSSVEEISGSLINDPVLYEPHYRFIFNMPMKKTAGNSLDNGRISASNISKSCGIKLSSIEEPSRGRSDIVYDKYLAKLINARETNLPHYDPSKVITLIGESYIEIYNKRHEKWLPNNTTMTPDELEINIVTGKISKKDIINDPLGIGKVYRHNKVIMDSAFEAYDQWKELENE